MADYTDTQGMLEDIEVENLFFDENNPRLGSHEARTQDAILDLLVREMSVDEVALSIAENGFYSAERLMVIGRGSRAETEYTVVEGNRRLAAVQLLLDAGSDGGPDRRTCRRYPRRAGTSCRGCLFRFLTVASRYGLFLVSSTSTDRRSGMPLRRLNSWPWSMKTMAFQLTRSAGA